MGKKPGRRPVVRPMRVVVETKVADERRVDAVVRELLAMLDEQAPAGSDKGGGSKP